MANKHLRLTSAHSKRVTTGHVGWWYEEPYGITVLIGNTSSGSTSSVKISWQALRAALARKDKEE